MNKNLIAIFLVINIESIYVHEVNMRLWHWIAMKGVLTGVSLVIYNLNFVFNFVRN